MVFVDVDTSVVRLEEISIEEFEDSRENVVWQARVHRVSNLNVWTVTKLVRGQGNSWLGIREKDAVY